MAIPQVHVHLPGREHAGVCTTQRCVTEEHEKRSACSCLCYHLSRFLQSYVRQIVTFASDKLLDMNRVFCIIRIVSAAHNMIVFFSQDKSPEFASFAVGEEIDPSTTKSQQRSSTEERKSRAKIQCTINH